MAAGRGKHSRRSARFTGYNILTRRQEAKFFGRFRWCRRCCFRRAGFTAEGSGLGGKNGTRGRGQERCRCRDLQKWKFRRRKRREQRGPQPATGKAENFRRTATKV